MKISFGGNWSLKLLAIVLALAVYYTMKSKTDNSSHITLGNDRTYQHH